MKKKKNQILSGNKFNVEKLLNIKLRPFEKFHKRSELKKTKDVLSPSRWPKEWKTVYFKAYGRMTGIQLPKPSLPNNVSFENALRQRKSTRYFASKTLDLEKISSLLFYSAGIKSPNPLNIANRFYPSGGSRYPLEVYLLSLNTVLSKGLYHYYVKTHSLEKLLNLPQNFHINDLVLDKWAEKAAALIIITAIFKRNTIKYSDRGYRFVLLETGHLSHNFYLTAPILNLSCCAIGGFFDSKMNELLDVDGINEAALNILAIGEKIT